MKFRIHTLVDVTDTGARRSQDIYKSKQQANFDTLYNVIGLRTNPTEFAVSVAAQDIKEFSFGSFYKGKQNIWTVDFYVEAQDSTSVELMQEDFSLVPVITDLDETANFEKNLFITSTKSKYRNIIFSRIDK